MVYNYPVAVLMKNRPAPHQDQDRTPRTLKNPWSSVPPQPHINAIHGSSVPPPHCQAATDTSAWYSTSRAVQSRVMVTTFKLHFKHTVASAEHMQTSPPAHALVLWDLATLAMQFGGLLSAHTRTQQRSHAASLHQQSTRLLQPCRPSLPPSKCAQVAALHGHVLGNSLIPPALAGPCRAGASGRSIALAMPTGTHSVHNEWHT